MSNGYGYFLIGPLLLARAAWRHHRSIAHAIGVFVGSVRRQIIAAVAFLFISFATLWIAVCATATLFAIFLVSLPMILAVAAIWILVAWWLKARSS